MKTEFSRPRTRTRRSRKRRRKCEEGKEHPTKRIRLNEDVPSTRGSCKNTKEECSSPLSPSPTVLPRDSCKNTKKECSSLSPLHSSSSTVLPGDSTTDSFSSIVKEEGEKSSLAVPAAMKSLQLVVGVNAVTRLLERGMLQAGLLCSTSPGLLCQHILPLVSTRGVPFAALPGLSETVAELLGIKRAVCIGLKVYSAWSL